MNCDGCIYAPPTQIWPCADCVNGSNKMIPAPKPKPKLSRWERRWNEWAKKQKRDNSKI